LTERCEVLPQASDFSAHGAFLVRRLQDLVRVSHDLRHLLEEFLVAGQNARGSFSNPAWRSSM
jgi:hypothetical protein